MLKRIISLLLTLCTLCLFLTACGGEKAPDLTDGKDVTTAPPEAVDKWEDVNFGGESIIVSLSDYVPSMAKTAGADHSVKYIQGPDAYTTDSVQNAVYDRNAKVVNALGLDVDYQYVTYTSDPDYSLQVIEGYVLTDMEDSPDILSAKSYGVIRAAIKGMLHNALKTDDENYFDFTADGWYTDYIHANTLNPEKIFVLGGDYFIDMLRFTFAILVNIDMYDEVFASEGGSESLFDIINSGEWTYDELMRTADMAHIDAGTAGKQDPNDDTFGIITTLPWTTINFFYSAGMDIFEQRDGKLSYIEDITEMHNLLDKLIEMKGHASFLDPQTSSSASIFIGGRSLYALDKPVITLEGTYIQSMDDRVAIIPYPKYYADEKYRGMLCDDGNVGCILYNSDKFTECSAFLQMMMENSSGGKGTLIYEYFEMGLKYKLSSTSSQIAMLEYIRDGMTSPASVVHDNYFAKNIGVTTHASLMNNSFKANSNTLSSDWEAQIEAIQGSMDEAVARYGVQE